MRKIKFAAIALLSAFALTACNDEIIAKPKGYDDNSPVIEIGGTSDIYNNNLKDIYDSIRSGNLASDVLDQLLYQYAVSVFGNYNAVTASRITDAEKAFGETTLKQAVAGLQHDGSGKLTGANDVTKAFIDAHSAFWSKDKEGKRFAEADRGLTELARLEEKWNSIEKRIAKKMYSNISGGTYSEENVFDEAKFVSALSDSIENNVIANPTALFKGVLTSKVEDFEVFTQTTKKLNSTDEDFILHRENYQSNYKLDEQESKDQDATYVEDKLIPDIYRELLVEQYILDKSYDTLGRTSARHISVLSLSKNNKETQAHSDLMETYVRDYVFDNASTPKEINLDSFKMVSNAWTGTFMNDANYASTEEYALMSSALDDDKLVGGTNPYFKGTAYGDMMEEFNKIKNDPKVSENESIYTGGNTYTIEVGKEIKTRELDLKNNTFTGWYIKSTGVANLPEAIKTKLFDINVANALGGEQCVEYEYKDGAWKANGEGDKKTVKVVGKVNGKYFLRNTSRVAGTAVENDIIFEDGSTLYIVLVEDALRSKNLDRDVATTPEELEVLETYINETVQLVSSNDTYKNLSKKHWLKEMNLKYHDTEIYNYFKSNFPELFK